MSKDIDPAPRPGWTLGLASTGSFMVVLDLLVVATALTTIRRHLGASIEQLEWTVNAYTLSFAVLLMTAAALGDRFGRRRMFVAGLGLFTAASAACALSPGAGWLITARAVQGAGAALVMPLALALLNAAVPPQRRGWAMGIFGAVTGLAAVVGPVAGGAITQGLAWQWIFWLNVPIGLLAIPLVLLAFTGWELRARAPMLPMRLFRSRAFSAGNAAIFFMAQFQQTALGQDPLEAGLRLLPWGVAQFLIAPRAGALSDRIGERPLIVAGLLSQTAAMGWLALIVRPGLPYPAMIAPMLLSGCGLAMAIPAATKAVVSSATQADIGKAAGAFSTMRQLGGAFGVAIGVAVFTAAGSYASPRTFSDGFAVTLGGCAALALAGAAAALLMPARATAAPRPPGQADVAASRGPEPQAAPGQAWRERSSRI